MHEEFDGSESMPQEEETRREKADEPSRLVLALDWLEDFFWPFRLFGITTIGVAGLCLSFIHRLSGRPRVGGQSLWGLWPFVAFLALIGVGLCFQQRWAAGLFVGLLFLVSMAMGISLLNEPVIVLLVNLPFLAVIAGAGVIVLRNWRKLYR